MTKERQLLHLREELDALLHERQKRVEYLDSWRTCEGQIVDASGPPHGNPVAVVPDSEDIWLIELDAKIAEIEKQIQRAKQE